MLLHVVVKDKTVVAILAAFPSSALSLFIIESEEKLARYIIVLVRSGIIKRTSPV